MLMAQGRQGLQIIRQIDYHPSFSPDGTKIVFMSERDGNYEIYIMNADGSGQINLTNNTADDVSSSFSH